MPENYGITFLAQIYLFESLNPVLKQSVEAKKKMVDILRSALSLQEKEKFTETVREFPCPYVKSKKEYKGKNNVINLWKEISD